MIRKLKSNKGETLIETMVSLLIAVLAVGLVASATLAASKMNEDNREADQKFRSDLEKVETYVAEKEAKQMVIIFEDGSHSIIDIDVYGRDCIFAVYEKRGD